MLFPLLSFITVGVTCYAGFLKLSARFLRYKVSWKSSFLFAVIMLGVVLFTRMLDWREPPAIAIGHGVVAVIGLIILGSWFFSKRGEDNNGTLLGLAGGAKLVGIAFAMMFFVGFAILLPAETFLVKHLTPPRSL
jgi:hypothetical protein